MSLGRPQAGPSSSTRDAAAARQRVAIESVSPLVDGARYPVKRVVGDLVVVEADVFTDGHDALSVVLMHRAENERAWEESPMEPLFNDRWQGSFTLEGLGLHYFTLEAWVDPFATWARDIRKKAEADVAQEVDLQIGAGLVAEAISRAAPADMEVLRFRGASLAMRDTDLAQRVKLALDPALALLMHRYADRQAAHRYEQEVPVWADRERARFGSWYEFFPRSCSGDAHHHGTFADCERRLEYVASMGFDVVYLPPVHPIGRTHRKGPNNAPTAGPGDPGSPWAIGSPEGGHDAVHPELGTLADFHRFVQRARELGLEVALDFALQSSPDHPYVDEYPGWFRWRPDGTVQYAENPPKRYEDIYPFDFEGPGWRELWQELRRLMLFWLDQGVRIFRVDNPHTKPFAMWEWLLQEVRRADPEVIFLSEAFTRPKVMYRLAKTGFSQSYTYFTWRNTKWELEEYFNEVSKPPVADFFRANLWPNTPDILHDFLQAGGRPAFFIRLVLAATLGANYGVYGPAFELLESTPREPGSEEYLHSEKYEIRRWDLEDPASLREVIARVNRIRRENPALQQDRTLRFHAVSSDSLICYSKESADGENQMLVVVNLDPHHAHHAWTHLDLEALRLGSHEPFVVHDLLSGARYHWQGGTNYVELDPHVSPAHLFVITRPAESEPDLNYYT